MSSQPINGKKLWQGAVYLSIAALIIKILSAIYRIPYQNIVGDVGFYVYQQIYPLYGIAIALSTFGFPVIISKLISEEDNQQKTIIKTAFWSLSALSLLSFLVVYSQASRLAGWMGDVNLTIPLKAVSFIFFVIPLLSVLRGFFQGREEMLPTAVSQVTEQASRVLAILAVTYLLVVNGYGPYALGTGAAIASIIGGFIGFCILLLYYHRYQETDQSTTSACFSLRIVKLIIVQGMMICVSSLLLVIFQFIDSVTVLRLLLENGVTLSEAKVAKGVFDRGQPLVQMGTVITTSFSLIVVPMIAKFQLEKRLDLVQKYTALSLRISFLIGAAASIGLATIIEPTNIMLFKDSSDSLVLAVMGFSILFTSIFLTTSAVLHGLNKVKITVNYVIVGVGVKVFLNMMLLPSYGTLGAAIATVLASATCAGLNLIYLHKQRALKELGIVKALKIVGALLVMAVFTYSFKEFSLLHFHDFLSTRLGSTLVALCSVAIGVIICLVIVLISNVFTEEELAYIPKISKLSKFIRSRISR